MVIEQEFLSNAIILMIILQLFIFFIMAFSYGKLNEKKQYPKEMYVSMNGKKWFRRTVIGEVKNDSAYITKGEMTDVIAWRHAEEYLTADDLMTIEEDKPW